MFWPKFSFQIEPKATKGKETIDLRIQDITKHQFTDGTNSHRITDVIRISTITDQKEMMCTLNSSGLICSCPIQDQKRKQTKYFWIILQWRGLKLEWRDICKQIYIHIISNPDTEGRMKIILMNKVKGNLLLVPKMTPKSTLIYSLQNCVGK